MRRKVGGILLGVVMILAGMLANPKQVQADAIASYSVSSLFYDHELDEWIEIGFPIYTTNGPNGEVTIYNKPNGSDIIATVKNGKKFNARQAYEDVDGNFWVYYVNFVDEINGWVRHEHLTGKYTTVSFLAEFKDRIIEEEWGLDYSLIDEREIYYWDYPGSDESNEANHGGFGSEIFVDEMGRKWGRTYMDNWICLDAPTADFETLYPDGAPERGAGQAQESNRLFLIGMEWYKVAGVGVLIVVVIGITLILLKKLQKK